MALPNTQDIHVKNHEVGPGKLSPILRGFGVYGQSIHCRFNQTTYNNLIILKFINFTKFIVNFSKIKSARLSSNTLSQSGLGPTLPPPNRTSLAVQLGEISLSNDLTPKIERHWRISSLTV